ncbi:unnamed protein product [Gordionus sp. m RMFG-2023]|uniref:protein MTO1 homolog, mitochondrial-like n=1 Tax=Gordionus sp. m RMFG-2023 TaxID=3053472 RepID=UPI0030E02C99
MLLKKHFFHLYKKPKRFCKTHTFHFQNYYDVIIVGGGHAGCEAASATARMGSKTLLITQKIKTIGEMSCNPSFGGIGKGQLMREIDALGGLCSHICDKSGVQYKVLNTNKGPAVWGLRAQIDRKLYKMHMQNELFNKTPNISILEESVEDLLINENETEKICEGVILSNHQIINSKAVIITTGTFLGGQINIGLTTFPAGRLNSSDRHNTEIHNPENIESASELRRTFKRLGFKLGRLKTGTPPRLLKSSINYDHPSLQSNMGDNIPHPFSFMNSDVWIKPENQLLCHLTSTNAKVHEIIMQNMHLNRHVREETKGPRYCPSIESKILRFNSASHPIWLEPEGFDSPLIYPQGMSCTLPEDVQVRVFQQIPGLEKVIFAKPGYGVEYDYIDPIGQLDLNLQTRLVKSLFLAGQINGTTGYEEAASQGIMAGINASIHCKLLQSKSPTDDVTHHENVDKLDYWSMARTDGYIGVLINDLVTLGAPEPYRMFTTRVEYRMLLRPDNADARLTAKGYHLGCVSQDRMKRFQFIQSELEEAKQRLKSDIISPQDANSFLASISNEDYGKMRKPRSFFDLLSAREVTLQNLSRYFPEKGYQKFIREPLNINTVAVRCKIEATYDRFLKEEHEDIMALKRDENIIFSPNIDYEDPYLSLSNEIKEKLNLYKPSNIAAANKIPGMTPDALLRLLRFTKRN